jgi:hypothetical protein
MSVANVQPLCPRKRLVGRTVLPAAGRGFVRPATPGNRRVLARSRVSCHVPARLHPTPAWKRGNSPAQKALESLIAATAAEHALGNERRLPAPRRRRSALIAGSLALTLIGGVAFKDVGPAGSLSAPEAPLPEVVAGSSGEEAMSGSSTDKAQRDVAEASAALKQIEEDVASATAMPEEVRRAINKATRAVGVDAEYMTVVAARESSFDPEAHAHHTTASGLYQFTTDTWLRAIKMFGAKHGLSDYAELITIDDDGLVSMSRGAARTDLLSLRSDPELAALMAAELARDNALRLERMLGRSVTPAETYMAHLFGVVPAARMIGAARSAPHVAGADLLPTAARSNPSIFNPASGPASAREIVAKIGADFHRHATHSDTSI